MTQVGLAQLCAATSLFTDLGTGQPTEHGLRTCVTAVRLADALGVDARIRSEVFYVSLLRFLGCTADAHQVAALAGGNEMDLLAGMAPVTMGSPDARLPRLIGLVAVGQPLPHRLRAFARALTDPDVGAGLLAAHCEVGARLATEMGLPAEVSTALGAAYARWDGRGVPRGLAGLDIPQSMRISIVARDVELCMREFGPDATRQVLKRRRGRAYDPQVLDAALALPMSSSDDFPDGGLWHKVLAQEPKPRVTVSGSGLMRALAALGDYADLKVPERSGRARRVAHLAAAAAATADFDSTDTSTLVHAALVHDLGVVAVPIQVLRASPRPGSAGWEQWRLHPHWTARILARCSGLERVAHAAGQHHERSDGSGYPTGAAGNHGRVAGVLACVVLYDELTTDTGASVEGAASGLRKLAKSGGLDPRDVDAVLGGTGAVTGPRGRTPRWPAALTDREVDVLRMLAHGLTNRQIATRLGISIKTVGTHVEHVYDKAGVRSRAAATLFAMQRELVG